MISELVTNAVRASAAIPASSAGDRWPPGVPPIRLWLCSDKDSLLIQVWDASDELPVRPERPSADAVSDRGLVLVDALCQEAGVSRWHTTAGKVAWAIIGPPGPPHPAVGPGSRREALGRMARGGEEAGLCEATSGPLPQTR